MLTGFPFSVRVRLCVIREFDLNCEANYGMDMPSGSPAFTKILKAEGQNLSTSGSGFRGQREMRTISCRRATSPNWECGKEPNIEAKGPGLLREQQYQ